MVRLTARKIADQIEISVSDNGIGIAPEYHEKIFEVFQRLHSDTEYPGTGIGLASARKAAERMGGTVTVSSVLGQGSTFTVVLPAAGAAGSPPPRSRASCWWTTTRWTSS